MASILPTVIYAHLDGWMEKIAKFMWKVSIDWLSDKHLRAYSFFFCNEKIWLKFHQTLCQCDGWQSQLPLRVTFKATSWGWRKNDKLYIISAKKYFNNLLRWVQCNQIKLFDRDQKCDVTFFTFHWGFQKLPVAITVLSMLPLCLGLLNHSAR